MKDFRTQSKEWAQEKLIEDILVYFNNLYKDTTVEYKDNQFIIEGNHKQEVATELNQMLAFSKKE